MIAEVISSLLARVLGDSLQARERQKRPLPWASVKRVSQRLNSVIELASEGPRNVGEVLSHLVETNPELTMTQIEKARSAAAEPTIELVKKVCDSLGASYQYVWHGRGTPFAPRESDHVPIPEYLDFFHDAELTNIFFVRSTSYPHSSFVALQYGDFKFRILPHEFHVSSENGNGGAASLSELAYLAESYHRAKLYDAVAWGLEVPAKVAEGVLHGEFHGSKLLLKPSKRSYWWDDLSDVEHKRVCAREYRSRYDREFFNAQELILWARNSDNK